MCQTPKTGASGEGPYTELLRRPFSIARRRTGESLYASRPVEMVAARPNRRGEQHNVSRRWVHVCYSGCIVWAEIDAVKILHSGAANSYLCTRIVSTLPINGVFGEDI